MVALSILSGFLLGWTVGFLSWRTKYWREKFEDLWEKFYELENRKKAEGKENICVECSKSFSPYADFFADKITMWIGKCSICKRKTAVFDRKLAEDVDRKWNWK